MSPQEIVSVTVRYIMMSPRSGVRSRDREDGVEMNLCRGVSGDDRGSYL